MKNWILLFFVIVNLACTDNQEVDCSLTDLELVVSGNENADCNDGASIMLEAVGGSGPYLYRFDGSPFQDLTEFDGIPLGGPFLAEVKDANGCEASLEVTVSGDENTVSFNAITANSGCGSGNGSIEVTASGGDGTYQYRLENGDFGTSMSFIGLESGNYQVSVKDGTDCINVKGIKVLSGISYENSVKPIIIGSCATTGCHVSGTGRENLTNFITVQSNAESIKSRVVSGNMPKDDELTDEEIEAIVCWVDDGALNN